jgi:putative membrane protein
MNQSPEHDARNSQQSTVAAMGRTAACGFLMGAADVIPGVSGGTVALILGIYRRLIVSISSIDSRFIRLMLSGHLRDAANHIDFRFVSSLGFGIACGIAGLASLMRNLLIHHRSLTYAAFCGLILASVIVVGRRIEQWSLQRIGITIFAAAIAFRIVTLTALQNPPDTLWYLFLCGMIGITAMILPGISGAFILVILQRYFYVVDKLRELMRFDLSLENIAAVAVFCLGCLTGLLTFSRFLKWLLSRHEQSTIAALCGFMLGAMYCLWPFQLDLTPEVEDFKHKQFAHFMPEAFNGDVVAAVLIFLVALAGVLALDRIGSRQAAATARERATDESGAASH